MNGLAPALVRLAARTLPPLARQRYREEWLADLDGAADAGVSRVSVVTGAFALAATIDRLEPTHTGLALGHLFRHRLRVASGLLLAGLVLLSGWYFFGGYGAAPTVGGVIAYLGTMVLVAGLALCGCGLVALLGAAIVAGRSGRVTAALLLVVAPVVGALVLIMALPFLLIGAAGPALLLLGIGAVASGTSTTPPLVRGRRVGLAAGFGIVALMTCAVGILHVFVWNPLARVPGLTLEEIYVALAAAGEGVAVAPWGVVWAVLTLSGAVALVAVAGARRTAGMATTRRLVVLGLLLVTGTTVVGFLPAFGMGMGLADTFMTSGGDAASTGPLLAIVGQVAFAGAVFLGFVRPAIIREKTAEVPS